MTTPEYDLAVVGGGLAGLYCGMHAERDWKVALFEGSHRFGGKLETVSMQGFDAEYGAMRFDPILQFRLGELIDELGIETLPFPEYSSPPAQQPNISYRLEADERGLTTLELYKLAIQRVLEISEAEMLTLSEEQLESIRREKICFGKPLWEQGLWNTLGRVISHNALRYIVMEGSFFHFIHENPGAAAWMITWVKMLQMSPNLRTFRHGMQTLTDTPCWNVCGKGVRQFTGRTYSLRWNDMTENECYCIFQRDGLASQNTSYLPCLSIVLSVSLDFRWGSRRCSDQCWTSLCLNVSLW
jgi:phytoene dehydrogenase-like protein